MTSPITVLVGGNEKLREATIRQMSAETATDMFPVSNRTDAFHAYPSFLLELMQQDTLFTTDVKSVLLLLGAVTKPQEEVITTLLGKDADAISGRLFISIQRISAGFSTALKRLTSENPETVQLEIFSSSEPQEQAQAYVKLFPFERSAQQRIISAVGKELSPLTSLVQQLMVLFGRNESIDINDVNSLLEKQIPIPPGWDLTNAIDEKRGKLALSHAHVLYDEKSVYFVYMTLERHFSLLRRVHDLNSLSETGIMETLSMKGSPYPVKKAKQSALSYGDGLYAISEMIEKTGVELRSRGTKYAPIAMDILISRLAAYPRKR